MPLFDLLNVLKRKKSANKVSFIQLIDKFQYDDLIKRSDVEVKLEEARIELALAKKKLATWKGRTVEDRQKFFHPSSVAQCARKTFYSWFSAPTNHTSTSIAQTAVTRRIFSHGDYFHLKMQVMFVRMGLSEIQDIEVPFQKGDEQGTSDCIAHLDEDWIVDFKSINDRRAQGLTQNLSDAVYEMQMRMYMKHFKIRNGVFIYENKNSHKLHEHFVSHDDNKLTELRDRIKYLRKHIQSATAPDRESNSRDRMPCTYCAFSDLCWSKGEHKTWIKKLNRKSLSGKTPKAI